MIQHIIEEMERIYKIKCYYCGGYVRDKILGLKNEDIDIEVYGMEIDKLEEVLKRYGKVTMDGKLFKVLHLYYNNKIYDFSLPRQDVKNGNGHKGFEIISNPYINTKEACLRRDYTINSMLMDKEGNIIDHYGGRNDLKNKILRCVDENNYFHDPLRVLRGMRFGANFGLKPEINTILAARKALDEFETLSNNRIYLEFKKMFKRINKYTNYRIGLEFLKDSWWIKKFPELYDMMYCKQEKEYHPEVWVWEHTIQAIEVGKELIIKHNINNKEDRFMLLMAILLHDIGKPSTTIKTYIEKDKKYRLRSNDHVKVGYKMAEKFMNKYRFTNKEIRIICELVKKHGVLFNRPKINKKFIARLFRKTERLDLLIHLIESDSRGRGNKYYKSIETFDEMRKLYEEIKNTPFPIITGRHIIDILGMMEGPEIGKIKDELFQLQLEGKFSNIEDGINILKSYK